MSEDWSEPYFRLLVPFLPLVAKMSSKHGAGIGIFNFLEVQKGDGSNCCFRYYSEGGARWTQFTESSRRAATLLGTVYNADNMIAVGIRVPGTGGFPRTSGECVKLYLAETFQDPRSHTINASRQGPEVKKTGSGLRKRIRSYLN